MALLQKRRRYWTHIKLIFFYYVSISNWNFERFTVPKFIELYWFFFAKALYCRLAHWVAVSYRLLLRTPGFWNIILPSINWSWWNTIDHCTVAIRGQIRSICFVQWMAVDCEILPLVILAPSGVTSCRFGSVQFAVCSVHCVVCSVQCAFWSVQCSLCSVQCAVCSVPWTNPKRLVQN